MSDDPRTQEEGESSSGPRDTPAIESAILDMGHVFEVLDHPRRRYLLYALAANDSWTLREKTVTSTLSRANGEDKDCPERLLLTFDPTDTPLFVDGKQRQLGEVADR